MIDARHPIRRIVAIHCLLFVLLFARRPGVLTKAQFWAEDGAVFFAEQLRFGFLHALSSTYAGYYHVLPRLIAGATSVLPARYVPFAYNLAALAIASTCCGLFAWPMCRHLIPSDTLRTVACLVAATAVYTGDEVLGNIANLQWFLLLAALILVAWQENLQAKPAWLNVSLAVSELVIALSAPLLLILLPWLVWQAARKRGLAQLPPLCAIAGCLIEIVTFLRSSEPHGALHHFRFSTFFVAVIATEISRPVLGTILDHLYLSRGFAVGVASRFIGALIVLSAGLTRLYSAIDRRSRKILTLAICLSLASIAVIMLGRNLAHAFTDPAGFRYLEGQRYFFLAACLFIFVVAFAIDRLWQTPRDGLKAGALLLLFSYGALSNFSLPAMHDFSWDSYTPRIDEWAAQRRRGERPAPLIVPINPAPFSIVLE